MKDKKGNYFCDFCGKDQQAANCMIVSGPTAICDECVDICTDIVKKDRIKHQIGPILVGGV